MEHFLVEFLSGVGLGSLEGDFLVGEKHEVVDKNLSRFFDGVFGEN